MIPWVKSGEYRQDIITAMDGSLWVVGRGAHDLLAVQHEMDPVGRSVHDYICGQFKPGGVFLDVGAHVGHYAIRAGLAGMRVYAVEANPDTMGRLSLNVSANKISHNVTLWSMAAWDEPTALSFSVLPNASGVARCGSSTLASPSGDYEPSGMTVAGLPLDMMLKEISQLDLVKLDVEGADIHVMTGMMASLIRLKPVIVWESHLFYGTYTEADAAGVERELSDFAGYTWHDITELGIETDNQAGYRVGIP